ncbi:hypothetical protein F5Y03DRAFT_187310 [Xylaria venustula]|nr:hypothetical protein F5Y03DRAFT_187310 [Xylaria venustula]
MSGHATVDRRPQSPPRRQRACLPCTKAKARCQYENNEIGDGCNRCQRLQIACAPQTTKSLRKPRQVKVKDKIDYVNISTTPAQGHPDIPIAAFEDAGVDSIPPPPLSKTNGASNASNPKSLPSQSAIPFHPSPGPGFGIPWEQAERAVEEFTNLFTAHLPFIILDHDITARRLFVEKPLLFRAILMITIDFTVAKSREIQRSIDAWIGQHLLVMGEQNIGVLQGLIVYIFWANAHFYSDNKATQLIYLAVGLAHSLGITRETVSEDNQAKKESQINEEHRAFLACYYFLSFNSFQFGRPNPLSTSYVQYCVDSLERSSEFATDFLLIKLVKFRQFIGRIPTVYQGICDTRWYREVSEDASDELHQIMKDLDDFMSDVSYKHSKLLLLWTLHNSAIAQLHLPMTYIVPDSEVVSRIQLESLQHCLQACRTFVGMVKSFSPDGFLRAPFTTAADLVSMFIVISRLLVLNIDGWDTKKARQSIGLKAVIDEVIAKVEIANEVKAARVAEAAVTYPSSYKPDGAYEDKHDRMNVVIELIESIRDWLNSQGAFTTDNEEPTKEDSSGDVQQFAHTYANPQSPQWTFSYFFESILKKDRVSSL